MRRHKGELENLLRDFEALRRAMPLDAREAFDKVLPHLVEAGDNQVLREQILDVLVDPGGVLSRVQRDQLIADAASDELVLRRIRKRAKRDL